MNTKTNGKAIKDALKIIGATNTLWGWKADSRKAKNADKVSGMNYWIAEGILTFEGEDGKTADVYIGQDYQICGFIDKTALMLLRNIGDATCVEVILEDGYLVFRECHKRMVLNNRFKRYEPLANGFDLWEAAA